MQAYDGTLFFLDLLRYYRGTIINMEVFPKSAGRKWNMIDSSREKS